MKRHAVILEVSAQADVRQSYEWSRRFWRERAAQKWARELRTAIPKQLRVTPKAFPLAPEDAEFADIQRRERVSDRLADAARTDQGDRATIGVAHEMADRTLKA